MSVVFAPTIHIAACENCTRSVRGPSETDRSGEVVGPCTVAFHKNGIPRYSRRSKIRFIISEAMINGVSPAFDFAGIHQRTRVVFKG